MVGIAIAGAAFVVFAASRYIKFMEGVSLDDWNDFWDDEEDV